VRTSEENVVERKSEERVKKEKKMSLADGSKEMEVERKDLKCEIGQNSENEVRKANKLECWMRHPLG